MPQGMADLVAKAVARVGLPGLVSVYLFGSHAESRAHRESDVDVGVLLDRRVHPTERARFEARLTLASDLPGLIGPAPVDVVILNDAPPLFGRHIVSSGLRVHCTDTELDHCFVRDVQLRAADLQPWLERMQRLKLDALGR